MIAYPLVCSPKFVRLSDVALFKVGNWDDSIATVIQARVGRIQSALSHSKPSCVRERFPPRWFLDPRCAFPRAAFLDERGPMHINVHKRT